MLPRPVVAALRLAFAAVTISAIVTQFVFSTRHVSTFRPWNFVSFFTIESNVVGAVALAIAGVALLRGAPTGRWLSLLRGAAALYMTITGMVYVLLLSGLEEALQTQVGWVNTLLHYVMPMVLLIDFLADRAVAPLRFSAAWVWLIYPVAYLAYSEIRGPLVQWYPYPFLDPRPHGALPVVITSLIIAAAAVALAWLLAWTTRLGRRVRVSAAATV
jgi:hypothetical protein